LVAAHLQWHLERRLRTLPLVERIQRAAGQAAAADADTKATGSDG
jgi:DNA repair protein RecO (recombination protein O)